MKKQTHRKDAKNAKLLCVFVKEFLCVLCISAVKTVFMDEHWIEKNGDSSGLQTSSIFSVWDCDFSVLFRVLPWPFGFCRW